MPGSSACAQLGPWRASRRGVAPQSSARAATAACSGRRGSGHRNAGTSGMPGNIIPWRASRCPPATSMAMARRTWSSGGIDTSGRPSRRAATVPLDILSGRTGRHLGSAGPLHLGFDARGESDVFWVEAHIIEPQARPDILVRHVNSFSRVVTSRLSPYLRESRLTRLSGRDGTVIWDISLIREEAGPSPGAVWPDRFGDLDGDGVLDGVMVVEPAYPAAVQHDPGIEGDLAGSRQPALVASARVQDLSWHRPSARHRRPGWRRTGRGRRTHHAGRRVRAPDPPSRSLDGRDGTVRWTWRGGPRQDAIPPVAASVLPGPNWIGTVRPGSAWASTIRPRRIGSWCSTRGAGSHAPRDVDRPHHGLVAADLTGDARDELLVSAVRSSPCSWARPEGPLVVPARGRVESGRSIRAASPGLPGLVIVDPGVGLDGAGSTSGGGPAQRRRSLIRSAQMTGASRTARRRRRLAAAPVAPPQHRLVGPAASPCPTTPWGHLAPPEAACAARPAGTIPDGRGGSPGRPDPPDYRDTGFLAATGLALVNVLLPTAILRLAARTAALDHALSDGGAARRRRPADSLPGP